MNIILHQPEIPANTGNIGRTCAATGTSLHLIEPLGFHLDEKSIRRAGMDYWEKLDVTRYMNFQEFRERHPGATVWMATTKARRCYTEVSFGPDDYIMFGKESAGIPEELLVEHEENCIRIPMLPDIRSLNLSNSAAVVLYEALRQQGFAGLQEQGALHRLSWKKNAELLFATSNPAKYTAMRDALQPMGVRLLCLTDMEQVPVAPEEGASPLENARQKALFYYEHYQIPLFSCDSGLYLEGLPQSLQPGLHVRSPQGVYLDDQAMQDYYGGLAARYGDITARYYNAICLILDREHIYERMDESLASERFLLTARPHRVRRPGFPLDSLSKKLDTGEYYYDINAHDADELVGYEGFVAFFREYL